MAINQTIGPLGQHDPGSPSLNGGSSISTQTMWACITALGVKPYKDGNMWCFLYGENIQEGIFGSGQTIHQAAEDFYREVMRIPAIMEEGKKEVAGGPRFKVGDVVVFKEISHRTLEKYRVEYKVVEVTILPPYKGRGERAVYVITTEEPVPFSTFRGVEEDELELVQTGVKDNPVLKVEAERVPYSWEEFCETHPIKGDEECYISSDGDIRFVLSGPERRTTRYPQIHKATHPNKETAEAFLALMQLIQLRNCYNDGWEPDWEDSEERKYVIIISDNKIDRADLSSTSCPLAFRTEERRDLFLKNFSDLIEIAKPLI